MVHMKSDVMDGEENAIYRFDEGNADGLRSTQHGGLGVAGQLLDDMNRLATDFLVSASDLARCFTAPGSPDVYDAQRAGAMCMLATIALQAELSDFNRDRKDTALAAKPRPGQTTENASDRSCKNQL